MKTKVMTKKTIPKIGVEQTKGNGRSYPYLYPIGDLAQGSLWTNSKELHVCTNQRSFLKNFLVQISLLVQKKLP
jgi:hypothetical protein